MLQAACTGQAPWQAYLDQDHMGVLGDQLRVEPPQVLCDDIMQLCSRRRSTRLQLQPGCSGVHATDCAKQDVHGPGRHASCCSGLGSAQCMPS